MPDPRAGQQAADQNDAVAAHLVEQINRRRILTLAVERRCAGGEQGGAWLVRALDGTRQVLKWTTSGAALFSHRTAAEVNRINAAGYPTPIWRLVGQTDEGIHYYLQDFVVGGPIALTPQTAAQIVEVVERQAGLAPDLDRDWSSFVTTQALDDDHHRAARRFLRQSGSAGRSLVDHYDDLLSARGPAELPQADLVHGDVNTANVLAHGGRITALIDIEALGHGTRVIDYAWLLREVFQTGGHRGTADVVRRAAEAVAGPAVLAVCAAASAFDIVRWISRRDPEDTSTAIRQMHDLADYLAQPLTPTAYSA